MNQLGGNYATIYTPHYDPEFPEDKDKLIITGHDTPDAAELFAKEKLANDPDAQIVLVRVEAVFKTKRVVERTQIGPINGFH